MNDISVTSRINSVSQDGELDYGDCTNEGGEVAYYHPALPSRPRANGRRKDAPRQLTAFVLQVMSTGSKGELGAPSNGVGMTEGDRHGR